MQCYSRILFSSQPATGRKIRKRAKYRTDATWPMMMKGCSTGMPPIQVKMKTSAIRVQKRIWVMGRNVNPRCLDVCRMGTTIRTRIEARRARTPPSLFGMDRRMA